MTSRDSQRVEPVHRFAPGGFVRATAIAALLWERLWPLAVPSLSLVLAFAVVSWFGIWQMLPAQMRYALLALFGAALLYALARLRRLAWPLPAEIERRIEIASHLEDRPIAALSDDIVMGEDDRFSLALWAEHRRRMAGRLKGLTAGAPAPDANRADPYALRAFVALIAFVAFGYSFGPGGGRIADAFGPPADIAELRTRLDAWINPPTYTRRPPIYLSDRGEKPDAIVTETPAGSEFFLRFLGGDAVELVYSADGARQTIDAALAGPVSASAAGRDAQIEFVHRIERSGTFELFSNGRVVARWPLAVIPDRPPAIRYAEMPSAALSGSLQMAYSVEDDYGVTHAEAEIRPLAETAPDARPLVEPPELPLPLPRNRARSGTMKANRDLTRHPWAGSRVSMTLKAHDDAGQSGESRPHEFVLPGRRFTHPLALALVEQRRIMALDARKASYVADLLDALTTAPEEFIDDTGAFMAMRVAYRRILSARDDERLRGVLDLLWETALALEYGDMNEAERKLREAQEALSKALEEGAGNEEIARLMDELRKAMDEFMQMLAREALQNPLARNPLLQNEMLQTLRQRDLDRMMDQIEDLARSGSRDAARQMLSELQRMMDNLRAGRHMQQRQAEGNRMNQALDKLSELMRRQQELMDETFRLNQENPQNRDGDGDPQTENRGQRGENGEPMTPEEFAEALEQLQRQQEALQQELGELGQRLEGLGLDPSEEFGEAEGEMGEAGENLGRAKPGDATGDQAQALEALRRGVETMMQQMAGDRQQGGQRDGQGEFGNLDRNRNDPLGRRRASEGLDDGDDTRIPGEIEAQRAREIMEAIRKRLSQPLSPRIEKDYLERLLENE